MHAVACSILLLNTDLHVADIPSHMSRNQFVRNTLQVIRSSNDASSGPSSSKTSIEGLPFSDGAETQMQFSTQGNNGTFNSQTEPSSEVISSSTLGIREAGRGQLSRSIGSSSGRPNSSQGRTWEAEIEYLLKVSPLNNFLVFP